MQTTCQLIYSFISIILDSDLPITKESNQISQIKQENVFVEKSLFPFIMKLSSDRKERTYEIKRFHFNSSIVPYGMPKFPKRSQSPF